MTLTDCMVEGSNVVSSKSGSASGIWVFSPTHSRFSATDEGAAGTRTGEPSVSNTRGPAARNTDRASSGCVRICATCSRVSSLAVVVDTAMMPTFQAVRDAYVSTGVHFRWTSGPAGPWHLAVVQHLHVSTERPTMGGVRLHPRVARWCRVVLVCVLLLCLCRGWRLPCLPIVARFRLSRRRRR